MSYEITCPDCGQLFTVDGPGSYSCPFCTQPVHINPPPTPVIHSSPQPPTPQHPPQLHGGASKPSTFNLRGEVIAIKQVVSVRIEQVRRSVFLSLGIIFGFIFGLPIAKIPANPICVIGCAIFAGCLARAIYLKFMRNLIVNLSSGRDLSFMLPTAKAESASRQLVALLEA